MAQDRPMFFRAALAVALIAALALSACGRKGALEAPLTGGISEQKSADTPDPGAKKPDRPFFLDPLI